MHCRRNSTTHPRAAGFTLLEIMVAMLLLAVIVTASVSLLFINIRGWDALVTDSEQSLDGVLIRDRLVTTLRQLSPLVWQSGGNRQLAFNGETDRVQFISRAPMQFRQGGLFEYLLMQELDSENRRNLVLYYAPYRPDQTEFRLPEDGERRQLFSDIGGVTFGYWGVKQLGAKQAEWWEGWENNLDSYPAMVRIEFAGGRADAVATTEFVKLLMDATRALR
ncbi:MAG: prepilin-type N-terminal cleavage/methylation domain-containing protein [Candidatus Thiodiazotropha sp.]